MKIDNLHITQFIGLTLMYVPSPKIDEGDTPLPLAYCVPPYFGLAYCVPPFFGLTYCVPFNNKNYHFWRFHLHKEDKMTVCCMHMYNHSCKR